MSSPSSPAPTIQVCHDCGGGAPVDAHFCPQCTKILSLGRHGDYFTFLGLPRRLNLNPAELEQAFRTLSRQFHPDYFYNAPPAERRASLERSSYLNDAYRTLKQPVSRVEYLLQLEGFAAGRPASRRSQGAAGAARGSVRAERGARRDPRPARLGRAADEWKAAARARRQPIERSATRTKRSLEELSARWDALVDARAGIAERRAPCSRRCASACSSATTSTTCSRASNGSWRS